MQTNNRQSQYFENHYYNQLPNDGIFVNPMRTAFAPPSPSESGESFFLHDPHEVIYNRVKDIFESDTSGREESFGKVNAMTVKAEIHSTTSSSGTTSDEDTQELMMNNSPTDINNNKNNFAESVVSNNHNSNHDYEDIYLVREEAKTTTTSKISGRSRSRDSGSHSRSASTSSTRSHEIIIQTKIIVSVFMFHFSMRFKKLLCPLEVCK